MDYELERLLADLNLYSEHHFRRFEEFSEIGDETRAQFNEGLATGLEFAANQLRIILAERG